MSRLKQLAQDAVEGIASERIVRVYPNGVGENVLIREMGYQDNEDIQQMFETVTKEATDAANAKDEEAAGEAFAELSIMMLVLSARDPETEELIWDFDDYEDLLENAPAWVKPLVKPALLVNGIPLEDEDDGSKEAAPTKKPKRKTKAKRSSAKGRKRRKVGTGQGDTQTSSTSSESDSA